MKNAYFVRDLPENILEAIKTQLPEEVDFNELLNEKVKDVIDYFTL